MSKDKCCRNSNHFKNEDVSEKGWTKITPNNVDSIYDEVINRVIVTDGKEYKAALNWHCGLSTMAKHGGYYYFILPELKIE